jgi:hypothetical protein
MKALPAPLIGENSYGFARSHYKFIWRPPLMSVVSLWIMNSKRLPFRTYATGVAHSSCRLHKRRCQRRAAKSKNSRCACCREHGFLIYVLPAAAHMHRRFLSKPIKVCSSSDRYLPLCPSNTSTELKPLSLCAWPEATKNTTQALAGYYYLYKKRARTPTSLIVGFLSS